jgi:hypothetical protein
MTKKLLEAALLAALGGNDVVRAVRNEGRQERRDGT